MKKRNTKISKVNKKRSTKTDSQGNPTAFGQVLRALGGLGGSALGGLVGAPSAGSSIGSSLGASLSRWLGQGDYTVSQNSLVTKAAAGVPMMHSNNQSIVVRHKELIATIYGSNAFTVQQAFTINPGLQSTFPWLSTIAQSYQEYDIRGMVYHYVPTSGTAISGTNSALGSVMIQTSYRSNDAMPTSKVQMMNEFWANEVVPSEVMAHPIECDPKENPFNVHYVRGASVPVGDNQLLYDIGVTYVATQGMQGTNAVGDLWVTYEIEFKKPVVSSNVTSTDFYCANISSTSSTTPLTGVVSSSLGALGITFSGSTITVPQGLSGTYNIWVEIYGTLNGAISWIGSPTLSNCALSLIDGATSVYPFSCGSSATLSGAVYSLGITKSNPSDVATITLPASSSVLGTVTGVRLCVYQLS